MDSTVANGQIRIDADVSQAVAQLNRVSKSIDSFIPGGRAVSKITERISGGFLQLVQGVSRNIFQSVTQGAGQFVSAGQEMAKTLESSKAAFDNLLGSAEDAEKLLLDIQKNAIKTPFDVDGLTEATQKLTLITKDGAKAEQTILDLGKALTAAGRGDAELRRMATNLQQIGTNAYVSARDIREFGNAGINIIELVSEYTGKALDETQEWLQEISNPYEVITMALNKAATDTGKFADMYTKNAETIKQVQENLNDAVGIFSYRIQEQALAIKKQKSAMEKFSKLLVDDTFTANAIEAVRKLVDLVDELKIVEPIIEGIKNAVSAFASGQFDNVIVFFRELFNTIKQFSGIRVITNIFKVFLDLFSDNHTAEEVQRVAREIGNLVVSILELKMAIKIGGYMGNLATAFINVYNGAMVVIPAIRNLITSVGGFTTVLSGGASAVLAVVAAIALFANITGSDIGGLFDSITEGIKSFIKAAAQFVKQFIDFGWNLMVGLWNGIAEGAKAVIQGIKEIGETIIETFKNVLGIHSPSTRMRDEVGQYIDLGIAEGIKRYFGPVVQAAEEVMEELVDLQAEYVKEMNDFGALDLVQQVNVYKEFAALYVKGTKARLEMDGKVHDAETAITKEIISLVEEYNKQFNKATLAAKEYYDMFEYTQASLTRTTSSVIEGLKRQNNNMVKYYQNLKAISEMGFDSDFMAYVYGQGMDAASEVAGLANATQEQIDEINELWKTRGKVATDIAVLNTKELKEETLEQIGYLQTGLETEVVNVYDTGTLLVHEFTRGIYDAMPSFEDAIASLTAKGKGDNAKSAFDIGDGVKSALGDIKDLNPELKRLNIEAFDTADIFSLIKNLLGGIPWYVWALGGVTAFNSVLGVIGKTKTTIGSLSGGFKKAGKAMNVFGGDIKTVTTFTDTFSDHSKKMGASVTQTTTSMSKALVGSANDIEKTFTKTTTVTQKAAKKVNDVTYSSATKTGENILKPFKTFNTEVKAVFNSITSFITSAMDVIFDTVQHLIKRLMGLITEFTSGLGKALKGLLKPLSDPKLLIGVGVLAALAVSLMLFAEAAKVCASVDVGGLVMLTTMSVILVGLAAVAGLLGNIAPAILAGASAVIAVGAAIGGAAAAIGLGLLLMASGLQQASEIAANINLGGLGILMAAMAITSTIFTLMLPLTVLGAVSGLAATILSVEFLVIAAAMALAGQLASGINLGAITVLSLAVAEVSVIFASLLIFSVIGAVAGLAAAILSVEFLVIAAALAAGGALGALINLNGIALVNSAIAQVSICFTALAIFATIGAIAGLAATILSVEFLVIAGALASGSALGALINMPGIKLVEQAIKEVSLSFTAMIFFATIGAVAGAAATILSTEFLIIAAALAGGSALGTQISPAGINMVNAAISVVSEVFTKIGFFAIIGAVAGAAASILSVEFLIIAESLGKACTFAALIDPAALLKIQLAITYLTQMNFGDFFANWGNAATSEKLAIVAQNVDAIVTHIADACTKLAMIDKIDQNSIGKYMSQIMMIVTILSNLCYGDFKEIKEKSKTTDKLTKISEDIKKIIDSVYDMVTKLAELAGKVGKGQVDSYVEQAKGIAESIGNLTLEDSGGGWFSKSKMDKTKEAAQKIGETSGHINTIISSTKNIVDILAGFTKEGISSATVSQYVEDAKGIMDQFSKVSPSQEVAEETKNNVGKISDVSGNVASILENAKKVVDAIRYFNEKEVGKEKVIEYVAEANAIIAEFGKLSLNNETENAFTNLSKNSSDLSSAVGSVVSILENAKKMVDLVKQYSEACQQMNPDTMVQQINEMLATIAGGNGHQGIKMPDDTTFSDTDVTALTNVKAAVNEIKEIATTITQIPDTAEKIGGVETVVKFITDTMSQVPGKVKEYATEYKGMGSELAAQFKAGWESVFPDIKIAGENAQGKLWEGIEGKMQDEYWQGAALAGKVYDGIVSKYDEFKTAGESIQGKFWNAIEGKMQDEYWQGAALGEKIIDGIWTTQSSWWSAGDNVVAGFVGGINRNIWQINQAAGNMSQAAINKLRELLRIKSPSRVMSEIGGYVSEGFANGIEDSLSVVESAGEALAEAVMGGYNDAIEPLSASAVEARAWNDQEEMVGAGLRSGSGVTVNQYNNIYDDVDMSKALSDISWQVARA